MTTEEETRDDIRYGIDRILGLSDGVFTFVVTLLVLDLVVPSLPNGLNRLFLLFDWFENPETTTSPTASVTISSRLLLRLALDGNNQMC